MPTIKAVKLQVQPTGKVTTIGMWSEPAEERFATHFLIEYDGSYYFCRSKEQASIIQTLLTANPLNESKGH